MKKARLYFEVKRKSDSEAVVLFPTGLKVGEKIDADKLLIALLKYSPTPKQVEGQSQGCCGHGADSCCVKW